MTEHVNAKLLSENYRVQLQDAAEHIWYADEPERLGGGDTAPGPMAVLLSSLGACTAVTLRMYADHKGWDVSHISVDLVLDEGVEGKPKAGEPRQIVRHVYIEGNVDDKQRERLLKVAQSCPVHQLLTGDIHIETELL